ncbi:hypothetical protein [Buttiauxella ferragutiae]|uniref:hypothetical protein n=1 Tax=Buttiauxella ferragutiae TaxID=82989 RepID=UPI0007E35C8A|nr:hypothetical protein [Buttiauxella ferragutiae]
MESVTTVCTGCAKPCDESELEAIATGSKFNHRIGYYCPACSKNKKSQAKLIKVRNAYHNQRLLRAGYHRY